MKYLYLIAFLSVTSFAFGQFTSTVNGDWNDGATWGNASPGTAGVDYPASATQDALIGSNVTVPAAYAAIVRDLFIQAGFTLTIASTGSVALNGVLTIDDDGVGGNGILDISGTLTANQGSSFVNDTPTTTSVNSTGKYTHNFTTSAGALLQATWNTGSTCEVIGYTTNVTAPGNLGQAFHHFIWNCPTGSGAITFISLAGALTTVGGDFTVSATGGGTRTLRLFDVNSNATMTVGGNVLLNGTSRLVLATTGSNNSLTVTGNFSVRNSGVAAAHTFSSMGTGNVLTIGGNFLMDPIVATTVSMASQAGGSSTMNVTGNFTMNPSAASTFNMSSTATSLGAINLGGNFSINANSTISSAATAGSNLTFNGSSPQSFSNSGTITTRVNYRINNGSTLNTGVTALVGTGTFNLQAGGTLGVGSADGLVTGTSLGNVRVSGARTYTANSNIIYNGSVAQNLGNEWGPSGALNAVTVNLEIANTNSSGVTNNITGSTNLVGTLTLTSNPLNIGNSNTLVIQSNFVNNGGTIGGSSTSNLTFAGSGTMGILTMAPGAEILNNLTVGRAGTLVLGSNLTITGAAGTINLSFGNLNFTGRTLTMDGSTISSSGTGLISTSATNSNLLFGGSTYSGLVPFSGATNFIDNLTFATPGGTFTWNNNVTINTSLTLTAGTLTNTSGLLMASNSTIFKGAGSLAGSSPGAVTSYNVTYTGTGPTGLELPSSTTALNNLTVNSSGTVTLASAITINGILTLSGGIFDAGSNAIDLKGNFLSGSASTLTASTMTFSGTTALTGGITPVFGAITITNGGTFTPSSNFQINGNLVNNGTLNLGSGTATFGGTTTISGSSTSAFNNIVISGTLTGPLNGFFIVGGVFTDNSTFNHNGSTVAFIANSSVNGSQVPNFGSITIVGTFTSPPILNVALDFTNNGAFNEGTGTVVFNGTSLQRILGSTVTNFNNITVTNPAAPLGVQVQTNQNLRGVLTLAAGSIFDPDGASGTVVFRLMSFDDAPFTQDAAIATLPATAGMYLNGNVTVQRYIQIEANPRIYRYISSPVQNAPVSQIQAFIPVTGSFTGTSSCSGCTTAQSMFQYDENVITDVNGSGGNDVNDGYTDFPSLANSETLTPGRGYAIFARGDVAPISTAGSALFEVRGPINSGTMNFTPLTTFTSSGVLTNDGWNLVGNPYPSVIDWDAPTGWTKTGIVNTTWMLDNGSGVAGTYATYVGGVGGTNNGTRYIPIGQAFLVKSPGPSGSINFQATEAVKSAGSQGTYFRVGPVPNLLRIALEKGTARDETLIHFTPDATAELDAQWDGFKLMNPSPSFNLSSVTAQGTKLAINSLPGQGCAIVQLNVADAVPGNYHLAFSGFESFASGGPMTLIDHFSGQSIAATSDGYDFEITTDAASTGNRFSLSFSGNIVKTDLALASQHACADADASVSISSSQAGISYYASLDGHKVSDVYFGNGTDLSIPIKNNILSTGENDITIMAASSGCDAVPFNQNLTVKKEGLNTASATGGTSCREGQATLTASGAPANGRYNWYDKADATTPIAGQEGSQFVTPVLAKTGTYFVAAVNSIGCEGERIPVVATIVNYDDAVITLVDDKTLKSNYATGNRWYLDGALLADTSASITIRSSGLYALEVKVGTCTSRDEKSLVVTGLGEPGAGIKSYPNPVSGIYYLELPTEKSDMDDLPVFNTLGGKIGILKLTTSGSMKKGQFDFTSQSAGFYYIRAVSGANITVIKVIKN